MSVRDKIAGFGGAGTVSTAKLSNGFASSVRIGNTSVAMSGSNGRSASASDGAAAAVRKLKVPDAFQQNAQTSDVPAASGVRNTPCSAASVPGASTGVRASASSSAYGAVGSAAGVSRAESATGNGAAPHSSASVKNASNGVVKPRGPSESGSSTSATRSSSSSSSSSSARASAFDGDQAAASHGRSDSGSDRGLASPKSRSGKPKAGPRKLNLTRISAEKQRAALCLDKKDKTDDGPGQKGTSAASAANQAVPAKVVPASTANDRGAPQRSSQDKPVPHASSYAPQRTQRKTNGGTARPGAAGIPSASSLRSSGHNLW